MRNELVQCRPLFCTERNASARCIGLWWSLGLKNLRKSTKENFLDIMSTLHYEMGVWVGRPTLN